MWRKGSKYKNIMLHLLTDLYLMLTIVTSKYFSHTAIKSQWSVCLLTSVNYTTCFDLIISFIEIDRKLVWRFLNATNWGDVSHVEELLQGGVPVDGIKRQQDTQSYCFAMGNLLRSHYCCPTKFCKLHYYYICFAASSSKSYWKLHRGLVKFEIFTLKLERWNNYCKVLIWSIWVVKIVSKHSIGLLGTTPLIPIKSCWWWNLM